MRLGSGFCLLQIVMATTVQITPRYSAVEVGSNSSPPTFSLSGHVGADTSNWYLHGWMIFYSSTVMDCLLAVYTPPNNIFMCFDGFLRIYLNSTPNSDAVLAGANYVVNKWFFVEVGSTSLGYYSSVQIRNGTPYTIPPRSPPFIIKETSYITYPANYSLPSYYIVRTK
jgi:hypothetical protein